MMLSRLSRSVLSSPSSPLLMSQRFLTIDEPWYEVTKKVETTIAKDLKEPATQLGDTVPKPTPFYGPERDHVNFPKRLQREHPVPSRLGFVPDSWFRFMYPKLGVTGPYTLGAGVILFLINKELFLIDDHEFNHFCAFCGWVYIFIKTPLGMKIADFVWADCGEKAALDNLRTYNEQLRQEAIAHEKEEQWRLDGKKLLFQAKKENVGLQLEAAYRKSVMDMYAELKRRLDYQVEVSKIDERIKQQFMVKWVLERVNESIRLTDEKENLKQCIANLNVLAARV